MENQSKFLGEYEVLDLENTPEVGVQASEKSSGQCYRPRSNDIYQTHHGIQPKISASCLFSSAFGAQEF